MLLYYVIATCSSSGTMHSRFLPYSRYTPNYYRLIASSLTAVASNLAILVESPHSWHQYASSLHTVGLNPAYLDYYQHQASNCTILAISPHLWHQDSHPLQHSGSPSIPGAASKLQVPHIGGTSTQAHYTTVALNPAHLSLAEL